jgi:hypothetical protein
MVLVLALVIVGLVAWVALEVALVKGRKDLVTLAGVPSVASLSCSALLFFFLFGHACELSKVNGGGFSSFYGQEEFIPMDEGSPHIVQWGPDVGWWFLIASIVFLFVAMLINRRKAENA